MMDRKLFVSVSIILLLTLYDLSRSYSNQSLTKSTSPLPENNYSDNEQDDISSIPAPKMKKFDVFSTVTFRYCHSCGYRKMFEQFSELVQKHYPNMRVIGENYPATPLKRALARILSMVKMGLLICLLFGQNPFVLLNLPTPRLYFWALQNKMYACLMLFFLSNSIESYLASTNAFEISVDNVPLWSKLETGRAPSATEFVQMLETFATNIDSSNSIRPSL